MPVLEVENWLGQVTGLYLTLVPAFLFFNNHLGPKTLEQPFCRDFLMAHFERISAAPSTISAAGAGASSSGIATAQLVPQLPKMQFQRTAGSGGFGVRGRVARAMFGTASLLLRK